MGAGISIAPSGKSERQPVARSLLTPPQRRAEDLVKRRFAADPDATLDLLQRLQHALSVKVSLAQAYARAEWTVHQSEDGTMRDYFLYAGPPRGMETAAAARAAALEASAAKPSAAAGSAVAAAPAPAPPHKGERSWKRKRTFGPHWEGEGQLDAGWRLVLAHVYLDEALAPAACATANRYARALAGAMIKYLQARQSLADVSVFSLLESDAWDRLEALLRSDPSAAVDTWGMQAGSSAQGLSVLQYALCRGAPASAVRLIISAHPGAVDEKTRAPGKLGPCLPLWQACRDTALGHPPRRSTDPPRPAPLAVQREVYIGNPLQCNARGPDKAVPLEDASPQFLFNRRVLERIARLQCPRLARRLVGGCLPLEAAVQVEGMSVADITKLVWLFPSGVTHRVAATRRVGAPQGQMLIGLVLERALYEHRLQSEALPAGAVQLGLADADPAAAARCRSNHVVDRHKSDQAAQLDAAAEAAVPPASLGHYVPLFEGDEAGDGDGIENGNGNRNGAGGASPVGSGGGGGRSKKAGGPPRRSQAAAPRRPLLHNRFRVYRQFRGVSTSAERRRQKVEGPRPAHFLFVASGRRAWVVAAALGQEKGHILRMRGPASAVPSADNSDQLPTNAPDGTGTSGVPANPWQVFGRGGWNDVPRLACWPVETRMERLHRLLDEALAVGLFDDRGVQAVRGKVAHARGGLEELITMVENRLASLRSLPALSASTSPCSRPGPGRGGTSGRRSDGGGGSGNASCSSSTSPLARGGTTSMSARGPGPAPPAAAVAAARVTAAVNKPSSATVSTEKTNIAEKAFPKRYRQLLEVIAKLHPDGWLQFAGENPKYALKLVQCKLDEGEVLAVHQMMAAARPKTTLDKLCDCQPCTDERAQAKAATHEKARVKRQLTDMRASAH